MCFNSLHLSKQGHFCAFAAFSFLCEGLFYIFLLKQLFYKFAHSSSLVLRSSSEFHPMSSALHLSVLLTICCHFRCVCCAIFAGVVSSQSLLFTLPLNAFLLYVHSMSVCPTYSLELPFWPCALCLLLFAFEFYSLVLPHTHTLIHTLICVATYPCVFL